MPASSGVPDFPLPVRMEYKPDGSARSQFLADATRMASDAKRQFQSAFNEIDAIIKRTSGSFKGPDFRLDVDLTSLREQAAQADLNARRLVEMKNAMERVNQTSSSGAKFSNTYIQSLRTQIAAAFDAKDAADKQVTTYSRLQAELDKTTAANTRLAQSYRATFLEQARSSNAAFANQQAVNSRFGLSRSGTDTYGFNPGRSARDAAKTFENFGYKATTDLRSMVDKLRDGDAALDRAAVSATTLEQVLGRVSNRGRQVGDALAAGAEKGQRAAAKFANDLELVLRAADPLRGSIQRLDVELERASRLFEQGAIDARTYGLAVNAAADNYSYMVTGAREGTTANRLLANSQASVRVASIQAGQQLQDIAISLQGGQRASVVFAQQLPQLAFALTSLEGSANKFQNRIGKIATFLAGPAGFAVLGFGILVSELAASMLKSGDDADKLKGRTLSLADALDKSRYATSQALDALKDYNSEQERARDNTDRMIKINLASAEARLKDAKATREQLQAQLELSIATAEAGGDVEAVAAGAALPAYRLGQNQKTIDELDKAINNLRIQDAVRSAEAAVDPIKEINNRYDDLAAAAEKAAEGNQFLARGLEQVLTGLNKAREAELELERARKRTDRTGVRETAAFASPLPGARQTSGFGPRRAPTRGASTYHTGLDLAAPTGTPVQAPQVGVVKAVGYSPSLGKFVVIDHGGGTQTRYGHLSDNAVVTKGQEVRQGDIIGRVGSTGRSTGPHLHYEVSVNGKKVDPSKGQFPIDPTKVAEAAQKAGDRLKEFGESAADRILRINEAFADQPRLIGRTTVATDQLNDLIKELSEANFDGRFDQMIADAERAKTVVADALVRPFRQLEQDSQRGLNIQSLVLSGRDKEAAILDEIYRKQDDIGDLTEDHIDDIVRIVGAREDEREVMERLAEVQGYYLDATRSVRSEVEAILSGQGKLSNLKNIAQRLQGQVLAEQLFGDVFRDLDKWVKEKTGIGSSVDKLGDEVDRSGDIVRQFTDVIARETRRLEQAFSGSGKAGGAANGIGGLIAAAGTASVLASATGRAANDNTSGVDPVTGEIVVVAEKKGPRAINDLSPDEYWTELTKRLSEGMTAGLDNVFGTNFFGSLSGALAGGLQGYVTGGAPGGIIGLLKGIEGLPDGLTDALGKAGKGAATGTAVAGIADAFGINLSNSGSQIGGAIGSALPIPGGDIIGAIAGGIIGKLLGGTKRGSATIGGSGSTLDITGTRGNSGSFIKASSGAAGDIISGVERIADALGASVDAALGSVSIGLRNGKYRVDTSGSGITKTRNGAVDFGKDGAAAAIQFATLDLIKDGVLVGLRQGTQLLLQKAKDLDSGLQKAVDFEGIFARLKAYDDPVGAAVEAVDKEFTRLRDIAIEAGEGLVEVERLYGIEREKAVKEANDRVIGSFRDLYEQLTIGDSGLSLRDRRANALAEYEPLLARVQAGDTSAYDDFAAIAQTALDLERQISGSQQAYFDLRDQIAATLKTQIDAQQALSDAALNADNPFSGSSVPANDNAGVVEAINSGNAAIINSLAAVNDNLGLVIAALRANGIDPTGANFGFTGTF